jgi:hypothetical protein
MVSLWVTKAACMRKACLNGQAQLRGCTIEQQLNSAAPQWCVPQGLQLQVVWVTAYCITQVTGNTHTVSSAIATLQTSPLWFA